MSRSHSCGSDSVHESAAAESALLKLYAEVWLPKVTTDGIVIDVAAVGGRPLQTTLDEKKQARVHDRIMELLVDRPAAGVHHGESEQDH